MKHFVQPLAVLILGLSLTACSGSFAKRGIALTVDQADTILANPSGFYLNIHTARNPDDVARGQLTRAQ
jgi:hypothetical protein